MGKVTVNKKPARHQPFHKDLEGDGSFKQKTVKQKHNKNGNEDEEAYLDSKTTSKILKMAIEQQEDMDEDKDEYDQLVNEEEGDEEEEIEYSEEEEILEEEVEEIDFSRFDNDVHLADLDQSEREAIDRFMPEAPRQRFTLADMIMAKIQEKEQAAAMGGRKKEEGAVPGLNPKVIEVYTKVGTLLSRYKSGQVPKAFKIIPTLANWEEILYITQPENWTPNAVYEATRVFVSNLKAKQCQTFYNLVVLDRVRDDIQTSKKLNYHLYMTLKKCLFKPAAFFKGILFPLCESGTCTLREAVVIGSVLAKVSIPVLHSAAALLRLAEMEYTGANSLIIRILLDKKYALPYKVVDALIFHFIRFRNEKEQMPVLWFQSLVVFVQRYKQDLTPEQKEALMELSKHQVHHEITPEIRRELVNSTCRGEMIDENAMMID